MSDLINLGLIAGGQAVLPQMLARTPEPDAVMDGDASVRDFNEIMQTNVSVSLCGMIELIGRIGFEYQSRVALDLACGPGHFAIMLAKYFDFEHVVGIDLSESMLTRARRNASAEGVSDRVTFQVGDVTQLTEIQNNAVDLVTCTNSAHHLPTLKDVTRMMTEMDRVVTTAGLGAVMDLTRMKSAWGVEKYVRTMGKEYRSAGFDHLYNDFRNSMFAAWTPRELASACPAIEDRQWHCFQINPVPINQFAYSIPRQSPPPRQFDWQPPLLERYENDYRQYMNLLWRSYESSRVSQRCYR
ncbi:MAG: class I SAM-dependent methyltransferase [Planctomycetota bacterium]|nr:class I SAM-dependent methyltransferase [Planctomycetota bacterium]